MESSNRKTSIFLYLLVLLLIALHGYDQVFIVDMTTVLLLILLMIIPVIPYIQKVKYGEFEAEISTKEVEALEEQIDKAKKRRKKIEITSHFPGLRDLVENDPALAVAKVRIEIEKRITALAEIYLKGTSYTSGLKSTIHELEKAKVIDSKLAVVMDDLVSVTNRVIRGQDIAKDDVLRLIDVAEDVMSELSFVAINRSHASTKSKITKKELKLYQNAQYEVKTIIPYERSPEVRTYVFNKNDLNNFLENYNDSVEFIIEIKGLY